MQSSFARFQEWLSEWNDAKTRQTLFVVFAVLVGLLVGMVIDLVSQWIGHFSFPPPLPVDYYTDKEELRSVLATYPMQAYFIKIFSWIIGTLGGGYISVRIAKMGQFPAWIVGILLYAGYLIGLLNWPNPLWVMLLCPLVVAVCAWGSGWVGMYMNVRRMGGRIDAEA